MRRLLCWAVGGFLVTCLLTLWVPSAVAADAGAAAMTPTTAEEEDEAAGDGGETLDLGALAEEAYTRAVTLMVVRALALGPEQLQRLGALQTMVAQQRRAYRSQMAATWRDLGPALTASLTAWLTNTPPPPAAPQARAALVAAVQAQVSLRAAVDQAAQQWEAGLGPDQAARVESPAEAAEREANAAAFSGATSPQEFLAQVADALRTLDTRTYDAVKYWEAERLVFALANQVPVGDPAMAAAQLLDMFDELRALPAAVYEAQRQTLPAAIAQALNLPTQPAATPEVFTLDEARVLFTQDAAVAQVRKLLAQEALSAAPEGEAAGVDAMEKALAQFRAGDLVTTLDLSLGQLRQVQPIVSEAGQERAATEAKVRAHLLAQQAPFRELADRLEGATTISPDIPGRWQQLEGPVREMLLTSREKQNGILWGIREFLSVAQIGLTDWPSCRQGEGPEALAQELRAVGGDLAYGRQFLEDLRRLPTFMYTRTRVLRAQELVAKYLPEEAPDREEVRQRVLDTISRAHTTPNEEWDNVAPRLSTDLMATLGALPAPGGPALAKPLAWREVYETFTHPEAGPALLRLVTASPAVAPLIPVPPPA